MTNQQTQILVKPLGNDTFEINGTAWQVDFFDTKGDLYLFPINKLDRRLMVFENGNSKLYWMAVEIEEEDHNSRGWHFKRSEILDYAESTMCENSTVNKFLTEYYKQAQIIDEND